MFAIHVYLLKQFDICVKVSKFQNVLLVSSFRPNYQRKNLTISALAPIEISWPLVDDAYQIWVNHMKTLEDKKYLRILIQNWFHPIVGGHSSYKIDRQHDIDHILTKILSWLEGTRPKLEKASGSSKRLRDPCGKKGQEIFFFFLEKLLEITSED